MIYITPVFSPDADTLTVFRLCVYDRLYTFVYITGEIDRLISRKSRLLSFLHWFNK